MFWSPEAQSQGVKQLSSGDRISASPHRQRTRPLLAVLKGGKPAFWCPLEASLTWGLYPLKPPIAEHLPRASPSHHVEGQGLDIGIGGQCAQFSTQWYLTLYRSVSASTFLLGSRLNWCPWLFFCDSFFHRALSSSLTVWWFYPMSPRNIDHPDIPDSLGVPRKVLCLRSGGNYSGWCDLNLE